jgi:hypothetical protein
MSKSRRLKLPLRLVFQAFSVSVVLAASCGGDDAMRPDATVSDSGPTADRPDSEMFAGYCVEGSFPGIDGSLCPYLVHSQADCPASCTFYG